MNEANYGSLEQCKRLVDAGIVLETEAVWAVYPQDWAELKWYLVASVMGGYPATQCISAPSMAEVWRELPEGFLENGSWVDLYCTKRDDNGYTYCGYAVEHHIIVTFKNPNPTDALICLLMWVRNEKEGGHDGTSGSREDRH